MRELKLPETSSKSGALQQGRLGTWDWSRDGGSYESGRDFFSVHWEKQLRDSVNSVRLHVESPKFADDAGLNTLKRDLVAALVASSARHVGEQHGYTVQIGAKTSLAGNEKR